jgi:hypothetical protein
VNQIDNFNSFIEESYLDSNYAPIYHFTNNFYIDSILEDNELKVGWFENPFFGKKVKIISFSRSNKLDLSHYKDNINVILCLDKNKLIINGFKLHPYDFFIQIGKETLPKSNKERKQPYEFEEATLKNISNIDKYLISIDFLNGSIYDSYKSVNILKKKNIEIYEDGRRIL